MSIEKAWLAAWDNRVAADYTLEAQRGKPGERAALLDMKEAQKAYEEISGLL